MKHVINITILSSIISLCTACDPQGISVAIGSDGGEVETQEGASVEIPAGALTEEITIEVTMSSADSAELPDGVSKAGDVFSFTPHGTIFTEAVTINIPQDGSANAVFRLDDDNDSSWELVAGEFTISASSISFTTTTFSNYVAGQASSSAVAITVTPDPSEPGSFCFVVTNHSDDVSVACEADSNGTCCSGGNTWSFPKTRSESKCGSLSSQTGDSVVTCSIDGTSISGSTAVTVGTSPSSCTPAIDVTADPLGGGVFCFLVTGHTQDVGVTCEADASGTCCDGGNQWSFPQNRIEEKCGSLSSQSGISVVTCTVDGTTCSDMDTVIP